MYRFNLRGLSLLFLMFFSFKLSAFDSPLTSQDYRWIGERIYQNETGGKRENLTFWSPAEAFPSFGLGHFIWIPEQVSVPFEPTFAEMVQFVSQTHPAPSWVQQPYAPWVNKAEFDQAWSSPDMADLRDWLEDTKAEQTQFIVQRFQQRLTQLLAAQPPKQRAELEAKIGLIMPSAQGQYALIDYVNFKGLGDNPRERYQGEGWGLLQVLQAMPPVTKGAEEQNMHWALTAFSEAAEKVLARRIALSPPAQNEQRWMPGWSVRVQSYQGEL